MGKTYKDKPKKFWRRIVKNSLYKKSCHIWGEDFKHKKKDKTLSKRVRNKLKNNLKKEIRI